MSEVNLTKPERAALAVIIEQPGGLSIKHNQSLVRRLKTKGLLDEEGRPTDAGVAWHKKPRRGRPTTNRVQGSITLPPELWKWVDKARGANELGRGGITRADFIERALVAYQKQEAEQP